MRQIADLHIHSKYSRACSQDLVLEKIDEWCRIKGIDIVATGDFTHPAWFKEIKEKLEPLENGLYKLKSNSKGTKFILGTEISCIYKQGDKCRRIHINIFFPEIFDVEKFNEHLEKFGYNLKSDGRPILGMPAIELAKISLDINDKTMIIPAHAWTPWFSIFGSKSGFDSIEECFGKYAKNIFAIETGLSSDPPMNWRLSALDKITLVSNSDAHSLPNLGREANVFDFIESSYDEIYSTLKNQDKKKFLYTIEFYPEEGKYHFDGHASCGVSMQAKETKKNKGLCPTCKRPMTIGVLNRVDQIADREIGELNNHIPYKSLVPLQEIIAEAFDVGKNSKGVREEYFSMIKKGKNEFTILLDLSLDELKKIALPEVVEGIKRVRDGKLYIEPGYDGVYGIVKIFNGKERKKFQQASLI